MLINCPECGKKISEEAKTCPHCGASEEVLDALRGKRFLDSL